MKIEKTLFPMSDADYRDLQALMALRPRNLVGFVSTKAGMGRAANGLRTIDEQQWLDSVVDNIRSKDSSTHATLRPTRHCSL